MKIFDPNDGVEEDVIGYILSLKASYAQSIDGHFHKTLFENWRKEIIENEKTSWTVVIAYHKRKNNNVRQTKATAHKHSSNKRGKPRKDERSLFQVTNLKHANPAADFKSTNRFYSSIGSKVEGMTAAGSDCMVAPHAGPLVTVEIEEQSETRGVYFNMPLVETALGTASSDETLAVVFTATGPEDGGWQTKKHLPAQCKPDRYARGEMPQQVHGAVVFEVHIPAIQEGIKNDAHVECFEKPAVLEKQANPSFQSPLLFDNIQMNCDSCAFSDVCLAVPSNAQATTLSMDPYPQHKTLFGSSLHVPSVPLRGNRGGVTSLWHLLCGVCFALLLRLDCTVAAAVLTPDPPYTPTATATDGQDDPHEAPPPSAAMAAEWHKRHREGDVHPRVRTPSYQDTCVTSTQQLADAPMVQPSNVTFPWEVTSAPMQYYRSVVCSDSGQYIFACAEHNMYRSSDYGETWDVSSTASAYWYDITSSDSGQYVAAVVSEGGICTSSDYGVTWKNTSAPSVGWWSVTSSGSGQYLAAVGNAGIFISDHYGATWNTISIISSTKFNLIASSSSGQYLAVCGWDTGIYTSNDFGVTWISTSALSAGWDSIVVSSNGQYLAACGWDAGVHTSSDYGATWEKVNHINNPLSITSCDSGQYLLVVTFEFTYASSDFGATWAEFSVPSGYGFMRVAMSRDGQHAYATTYNNYQIVKMTQPLSLLLASIEPIAEPSASLTVAPANASVASPSYPLQLWDATSAPVADYHSLACSATGQYVFAGVNTGGIYVSSDYGESWMHSSAPSDVVWQSIASSDSGQYLAATVRGMLAFSSGNIYTSSDFGATWNITSAPFNIWESVVSSSSGQYLAAASYSAGIYTSSDYGVSWNLSFASVSSWKSITSSSSGQYLAACGWDTGIYTSSDFGATWNTTFSTDEEWDSIVVSSNGQHLVAVSGGYEGIVISSDYGATWLQTASFPMDTVLCISNSQYLLAYGYSNLFVSADFGATWGILSAFGNMEAMIGSNDGQYVYGIVSDQVVKMARPVESLLTDPSVVLGWHSVPAPVSWHSLTCSSSGQYLVTIGYEVVNENGSIYTSSDYGESWAKSIASVFSWEQASVTSSDSGQYVAAAVGDEGGIYNSADYGVTWNMTSAPRLDWRSIASSSSGRYLAAVADTSSIYTSSDYGHSWSNITVLELTFWSIASNSNGQHLTAVASNCGSVATSHDYGATWNITHVFSAEEYVYFQCVTSSSSGQYLAISTSTGGDGIYTSNDYGVTWVNTAPIIVKSIAASGSGRFLLAFGSDGVYSSANYGVTWTVLIALDLPVPGFAAISKDGQYTYAGAGYLPLFKMIRPLDSLIADTSPLLPSVHSTSVHTPPVLRGHL